MSDKKEVKKLPIIKTKSQLTMILNGLNDQGFGYYVSDWKAHDKKIESIIHKNNTYGIKEDSFKGELIKNLENLTNYDEIEKAVKSYFTKFKPDDKIKELLKSFYLHPDVVVRVPSTSHPDRNDIIAWVRFKRKYGIKGEPNFGWDVSLYNLDKNFVKINIGGSVWESEYNFTKLYELIYGEQPNEWSLKNKGDWQDLGKIQVKIFQNGTMNIKGDIKDLKRRIYDDIRRYNSIIIYNNKMEIFKQRTD
ncbi:hypothetical protein K9L67_06000 [Candidatus Woesearchaeota archaeon]|nr:hypothetical protein [Candidatus Woesearchaeota archaeon]MCF7901746.1 hypothetical protein [Candidatus Woesearchaeota archaeon]